MLPLFLACITLMVGQSLGGHTYTELDLSNPTWKAQFAKNYETEHINVSPDNIHIDHAVHDHNHVWLLGTFEWLVYTIRVNGGKPCNVTTVYAFHGGIQQQQQQDRQINAPFVNDLCGIVVTSDIPVPEGGGSVATDDMPYLDEPVGGVGDLAEETGLGHHPDRT